MVVVDATYASHTLPLLRSVCAELGLRLVEGDDSDDDATTVFWHSLSNAPYKARRAALRDGQWVSKLWGARRASTKAAVADACGSAAGHPATWVLPRDAPRLAAEASSGWLIVKPADGAKGTGIWLARDAAEVLEHMDDTPRVCQRYVADPLLDGAGRKFDLRLYVLLMEAGGDRRAYLCRDGLVRSCARPYAPPDASNRDERTIHLCNTAVNSNACKRGLAESVADGGDLLPWPALAACAAEAAAALWASLDGERRRRPARPGKNEFQLFGFDVLLDAAGAAHLLEINCNPSMRVDDDPQAPFSPDRRTVSPLDERVKRKVLGGALSLVLGLGAGHAAWWDELPPAPRASFFE